MRGASEFGWPKGCKSFQRLTTVLALGCCTLLPAPSFGQARGIPPPSVTSMGGGHHLAFPPPSVTSMGPYRYGYGFHNHQWLRSILWPANWAQRPDAAHRRGAAPSAVVPGRSGRHASGNSANSADDPGATLASTGRQTSRAYRSSISGWPSAGSNQLRHHGPNSLRPG